MAGPLMDVPFRIWKPSILMVAAGLVLDLLQALALLRKVAAQP